MSTTCPHAASGCDYPAGECAGHCASKHQPKALLLADALDAVNTNNADSLLVQMAARSAAAELRRLYEENVQITARLGHATRRALVHKEQRDELLEACKALTQIKNIDVAATGPLKVAVEKSAAAIAKAGGAA